MIYSYAIELLRIEEKLEDIKNSTIEMCKYENNIFKEWYRCGHKVGFYL